MHCISSMRTLVDQLLTNRTVFRTLKTLIVAHHLISGYGQRISCFGPVSRGGKCRRGKACHGEMTPSVHGGFCVDPRRRGTQRHLLVCFVCSFFPQSIINRASVQLVGSRIRGPPGLASGLIYTGAQGCQSPRRPALSLSIDLVVKMKNAELPVLKLRRKDGYQAKR